ncbi:MAG: hypothetical protein ABW080_13355 [Candidatus Thiodiazotropha sp.]
MIHLPKARIAWNHDDFNTILKDELEAIDPGELPLQQGLTLSSMVSSEPFNAIVIDSTETSATIRCKVSIIYSGIIAGCSCADDPTPLDIQTEYCELLLAIDKVSGVTLVELVSDSHCGSF